MDETIYVILKVLFDFALEVWLSIVIFSCHCYRKFRIPKCYSTAFVFIFEIPKKFLENRLILEYVKKLGKCHFSSQYISNC